MKIKLPRRRKKRYIAKYGSLGYMSAQVANEFMYEEEPIKYWTRFQEFSIKRNKIIIHFNY